MKTIVVTGATSFLGYSLIKKLVGKYRIYAVIRKNSTKKELISGFENTNIIELDMNDYSQLYKYVKSPDILVHFAWEGTRDVARNDKVIQESNYRNSIDCIECLIRNGCQKIILSGSQAEYGNHNEIIDENTVCNPDTEYGKYKLKLYNDVKKIYENKATIIEPRYFSIYGPRDYSNSLVMSCIRKMLNGDDVSLTKCIHKWNFLYVEDATDCLAKIIESDIESGVYNISSNENRFLKEYVEGIYKATNSKSILKYGEIPYSGEPISITSSNTRIEKAINWKQKISFIEGIEKTIDWYRINK